MSEKWDDARFAKDWDETTLVWLQDTVIGIVEDMGENSRTHFLHLGIFTPKSIIILVKVSIISLVFLFF
jgi:hypothetical protein